MTEQRFSSEWWAAQVYVDGISKTIKRKRLAWCVLWGVLAKWMPFYVGRSWRVFVLERFGMKHNGHVTIYPTVKVWAPWNVEMGSYVAIDDGVNLYSADRIKIGTKVAISRNSFICTASHDITKANRPLVTAPIEICDGVWIGAHAIILPGVTVGEGAVVGACAVVTKDVEPWTVVAGNPARVIKKRTISDRDAP
jgi:putative colanic acid biosynthesis acetyltransferase WcaF